MISKLLGVADMRKFWSLLVFALAILPNALLAQDSFPPQTMSCYTNTGTPSAPKYVPCGTATNPFYFVLAVAPSAPQSLAAGTTTGTTIPLTWAAPATGTPASYTYTALYALHGTGSYTLAASGISGLSYAITGLTASTSYDVQVTASNSYSTGPAATLSNVSTAGGGGLPNNYVADGAGGYVSDGAGGVVLAQ